MKVWGNMKKISFGGMIAGAMIIASSFSVTGCLTDEKNDEPTPTNKAKSLTVEKKDTVWNVKGPNKGAYNLVSVNAVAEAEANTNKDLVDMAVLAGGTVTWPKTLTSLNGTLFVKAASGFDYAAATDSTVIKAYAAGTGVATTATLVANDVILAKLRGGNTYAAVKVYAGTETSADNKDFINFGYRLTP